MSEIKFWRYVIPSVDGIEGWGIFVLDSTGMFSCVTDYGNYAYKWTHHDSEGDFRSFFKADSYGYYVQKLFLESGGSLESRPDETVDNIKRSIIESRWNDYMSEKDARKEWDLLADIDWSMGDISLYEWHQETGLTDAHELFVYDYPPSVKGLRDKLLPRFCEHIKQVLIEEEKAHQKAI